MINYSFLILIFHKMSKSFKVGVHMPTNIWTTNFAIVIRFVINGLEALYM